MSVVDGDTLEVRFPDGRVENVRLLGVDSPETHTEVDPAEFEGIPTNDAGEAWLRDRGEDASAFAAAELDGELRIATDPSADRRGSYGRLLVYVYEDGALFNEQLLVNGHARLYDTEFSKRSAFAQAEQTAQEDDVGLWGFEAASTTTTTTQDDGGDGELAVATIHADADGNDHENENDEYIVFENTGDGTLDLSGWTIADEAGHDYIVPEGVTLEPGATITLYTGSGTDSDTELYWGSDAAIWNNGGDTIIVTDDSGEVVLEREYS